MRFYTNKLVMYYTQKIMMKLILSIIILFQVFKNVCHVDSIIVRVSIKMIHAICNVVEYLLLECSDSRHNNKCLQCLH